MGVVIIILIRVVGCNSARGMIPTCGTERSTMAASPCSQLSAFLPPSLQLAKNLVTVIVKVIAVIVVVVVVVVIVVALLKATVSAFC